MQKVITVPKLKRKNFFHSHLKKIKKVLEKLILDCGIGGFQDSVIGVHLFQLSIVIAVERFLFQNKIYPLLYQEMWCLMAHNLP